MAGKLRHSHTYDYPRPALTADVVLIAGKDRPRVLLIQRKHDPFAGAWAIPGGFVNEGETILDAAKREFLEETGIAVDGLEQLYTAGDPGRDPRGWTVTVAFLAQTDAADVKPTASDDAADVKWFLLSRLPKLAFDHAMILERAKARLIDRKP